MAAQNLLALVKATAGAVQAETDDADDLAATLDGLDDIESATPLPAATKATSANASIGTAALPAPGGGVVDSEAESVVATVKRVNEDGWFVAPDLQGTTRIHREYVDPETGQRAVAPVSEESLRLHYLPVDRYVHSPNGVRRETPATLWLKHAKRRQYASIGMFVGECPPDAYNLYRGWGVEPRDGDAAPFVDHVRALCSEHAVYVLDWLAHAVQNLDAPQEVALVLRGGQGTGKGTLARAMLNIFGAHGLHITQPKHLTGNFNGHLRHALFLFADEAVWAGDKTAVGVLKGIITEPTIAIEGKFKDVGTVRNRLKVMMASNAEWVVPAESDERRYCVIDVPDTLAGEHGYFSRLHKWLRNGGAGVVLRYLLDRDLSAFNVRDVPRTRALSEQKLQGLPVLDRWLLDALTTGTALDGTAWGGEHEVVCTAAVRDLHDYAARTRARYANEDARTVGKRLNAVFGCGPARMSHKARVWQMPALDRARQRAERAFGIGGHEWE